MNSTANNRFIFLGFIAGGFTNIFGMLAASEFFTNTAFHKLSPEVFSDFGTFMVMVWGLAYLAVAKQAHQLPAICFVFAFEKAIYVYTWVIWISSKSDMLPVIREETPLLALFYSSYGLIDLAYALFFAWVGIRALQTSACTTSIKTSAPIYLVRRTKLAPRTKISVESRTDLTQFHKRAPLFCMVHILLRVY